MSDTLSDTGRPTLVLPPARRRWAPAAGRVLVLAAGVALAVALFSAAQVPDPSDLVVLATVGGGVLAAAGALSAVLPALLAVGAARAAWPGEEMSRYGRGRRVTVTWAGVMTREDRFVLEDRPAARLDGPHGARDRDTVAGTMLLDDPAGGEPARLVVRAVERAPGAGAARGDVTAVEDDGRVLVRAWSDRGPRGLADWTVVDGDGPVLRLRTGPGRGAHTTLVDADGVAWFVRDRRVAELPEELSTPAALLVLRLVGRPRGGVVAGAP